MTKTNCISCGQEIDTNIHPDIIEGHLCFDCYFDYTIMKGVGETVPLFPKGGYKDAYL